MTGTTIGFCLSRSARLTAEIYDPAARLVRELVDAVLTPGDLGWSSEDVDRSARTASQTGAGRAREWTATGWIVRFMLLLVSATQSAKSSNRVPFPSCRLCLAASTRARNRGSFWSRYSNHSSSVLNPIRIPAAFPCRVMTTSIARRPAQDDRRGRPGRRTLRYRWRRSYASWWTPPFKWSHETEKCLWHDHADRITGGVHLITAAAWHSAFAAVERGREPGRGS